MHQLPAVLKRLQQQMLQQDSAGRYRLPGELLFPLSTAMSNLQASMDDAGMPFLHSSYTDAAATTGSTACSVWQGSTRSLIQLLSDLGVREASADMVAAHILKLYLPAAHSSNSSSTDAVPFDQHMTHL
jgi:hypothetical protein